jgi:AraC family transcriptional regulator of adaptative response / DNA-3-methyladenine glycosylase II
MTAIAEHGAEVLRGPAARIRAVTGAAAALASGALELGPGDDSLAQREALLALPGVGPWTADYVRMRVLGDPDITLPGDVAVRAGAAAAGSPPTRAGTRRGPPVPRPGAATSPPTSGAPRRPRRSVPPRTHRPRERSPR